jgi:hypothetical protein
VGDVQPFARLSQAPAFDSLDEDHRRPAVLERLRLGIGGVDLLGVVAAAAKEANGLIEQRTFSWTQLFNHLEATLPEDVMLTSVHPDFNEGVTQVNMSIQGKGGDEIDKFWERLEKTGAFHGIEWSGLTVSEEGIHHVEMTAIYTGAAR